MEVYTIRLLLIAATKFSHFSGNIKIAKFSSTHNHYFLKKNYIARVAIAKN